MPHSPRVWVHAELHRRVGQLPGRSPRQGDAAVPRAHFEEAKELAHDCRRGLRPLPGCVVPAAESGCGQHASDAHLAGELLAA
eukprot:2679278-Alexandrium_andersonii.AAC.1